MPSTIVPTITRKERCTQVVWASMANGDVGAPLNLSEFADRSVQAIGTYGAGGNVAMEGSNELVGTNWAALTDQGGTTIALGAATTLKQIEQASLWIRPHVTAGDGTTLVSVQLFVRRPWAA